jgi:TfoX/Sxy family transcriptional regulator of competence genes
MSPAKRAMPKIPKPTEETKEFFRSVVPDHPTVAVKPMFGNLSAFVNGNMFAGIFGPDVFVRLSEKDDTALRRAGGGPFEVMPGRAIGGYTMLPEAWRTDRKRVSQWVERSLTYADTLPPKQPKRKKPKSA